MTVQQPIKSDHSIQSGLDEWTITFFSHDFFSLNNLINLYHLSPPYKYPLLSLDLSHNPLPPKIPLNFQLQHHSRRLKSLITLQGTVSVFVMPVLSSHLLFAVCMSVYTLFLPSNLFPFPLWQMPCCWWHRGSKGLSTLNPSWNLLMSRFQRPSWICKITVPRFLSG